MIKKFITPFFFVGMNVLFCMETPITKDVFTTYEMVLNIRKSREKEKPLSDNVQDIMVAIGPRNEKEDQDFFSFLFPKEIDRYNEIPNFVFEDLFECFDVYEYYKGIFENKLIIENRNRLIGYINICYIANGSSREFTIYQLEKKFFKLLITLKARNATSTDDLKKLPDDTRSYLNKILGEQSYVLAKIRELPNGYDILSLEQVKHISLLEDICDDQDQIIEKNAEKLYSDCMYLLFKNALEKKQFFINDDEKNRMNFFELLELFCQPVNEYANDFTSSKFFLRYNCFFLSCYNVQEKNVLDHITIEMD